MDDQLEVDKNISKSVKIWIRINTDESSWECWDLGTGVRLGVYGMTGRDIRQEMDVIKAKRINYKIRLVNWTSTD